VALHMCNMIGAVASSAYAVVSLQNMQYDVVGGFIIIAVPIT